MAESIRNLLQKSGLKFSKQRESILTLLRYSKQPLTAQEITDKLNIAVKSGNKIYWPSTIYRTLDLLLNAKLVVRLDIPEFDQAAFILNEKNIDQHFAICLKCRRIISLKSCPIQHVRNELTDNGFFITSHRVEIYGYCHECCPDVKCNCDDSAINHTCCENHI